MNISKRNALLFLKKLISSIDEEKISESQLEKAIELISGIDMVVSEKEASFEQKVITFLKKNKWSTAREMRNIKCKENRTETITKMAINGIIDMRKQGRKIQFNIKGE